MIRQTRCLVLVCDGCRAVLSHPDTEAEIHYDTAVEVRRDATEDLSWSRAGERDLCPGCTCAEQGHEWPGWTSPLPDSRRGPYRWCARCGAFQAQGVGVIVDD